MDIANSKRTLRDRISSQRYDPAVFAEYGMFDRPASDESLLGDCVLCRGNLQETGPAAWQCTNCRISYRHIEHL